MKLIDEVDEVQKGLSSPATLERPVNGRLSGVFNVHT